MNKVFLTLGLIGCLSFAGASGAEASTATTFTAGQGCSCADGDNWVNLTSPSSVTLTCPGAGSSAYHDTALPGNTIQEYSCSTFPGATPVVTDSISGKVMVSYVTKQCPKGYVTAVIKKAVKTSVLSPNQSGVAVGYCTKATAPTAAATVK